jgi:hypothetical protein
LEPEAVGLQSCKTPAWLSWCEGGRARTAHERGAHQPAAIRLDVSLCARAHRVALRITRRVGRVVSTDLAVAAATAVLM